MRAKNHCLLFDLDEIEQAETENYVDIDIADVNLNRNAAIMLKKISDKYKKIRRKRKRARSTKKAKKKKENSKKLVMMAAKKYVTNIRTCVIDRKKMDNKQVLEKAKNLFIKLKTDPASVIFAAELLDMRLLKKLIDRSTLQICKFSS